MRTSRGRPAAIVATLAAAVPGQAQDQLTITDVSPAGPRAGQPVQVALRAAGSGPVRVCLVPKRGAARCEVDEDDRRVTFAGPYPGRWTVTAEAAGATVTRPLTVRPGGGRLTVLALGDSLVRAPAAGLANRLRRRTDVVLRVDLHNGSGLSPPCCLDWVAHAEAVTARLDPDVAVVFLGANEGYSLAGDVCCGDLWVERYAARLRAFIAALSQDGRTRVYYATLPAPSGQERRRVWTAVNDALGRVTTADEARVFDVGALISPGFRYRRAMPWRGRRVVVRRSDGIHLNRMGGRIVADMLLRQLQADGVDVPAAAGGGGRRPGSGGGDAPEVGLRVRLRPERMVLELDTPDPRRTLHEIDVHLPRSVRIDPEGIPICAEQEVLERRCGTRTGATGTAVTTAAGAASGAARHALALVRLDAGGGLGLSFSTASGEVLVRATLRELSGHQRLRLRLPPALVGTSGVYRSLRSLRLSAGSEHGDRAFVSVSGCRRHVHRLHARLRFLDNGLTPDARVDLRRAAPCR